MRKAVVIGGAGFLGRRTVECLVQHDIQHPQWAQFDEVCVFDLKEFKIAQELRRQSEFQNVRLNSFQGDIRSLDDIEKAVRGAHTVFHMASMVYVDLAPNPIIDEINVEGTQNVVTACQNQDVQCLIYTSSEDVVLGKQSIRNGDETLPYPNALLNDYVRTKIEGEKIILSANGKNGLHTCSLRPVHIYGPGDPHAIIPSLKAFAKGDVPFLLGSGKAKFDVVFVDNVVHAHLLAANYMSKAALCENIAGQAFFIGEGHRPNYFDWLRPLAESRDIRMPRRRISFPLVLTLARGMEIAHKLTGRNVPFHRFHAYVLCNDFYFSNAKAEASFGYKPIVESDEGMRRTIEWLKGIDLG